MASEYDAQYNAILDQLTAPGGPLETVPLERFGTTIPMLKLAPPTLPAFFAHYCAQHGDLEFLVDGEVRLTFAQTHALARRLAGGLVAGYGVQKGDRVAIAARNSANWILAYMAVLMAGGCATLVNAFCTGEEMAAALAQVGCTLVLADPARAARLAEEPANPARIVAFTHGDPGTGLAALLDYGGGAQTPLPDLSPGDHATIVYTSGSTGLSKGALSDHRGVVHAALSYAGQSLMMFTHFAHRGMAPTMQQCTLISVPLFHVTGEVPLFLQSFALGRRLVNMARWDAEEAMRLIAAEKVTYFIGVPLMSFEIATHPRRAEFDLSSCAFYSAGGAPRPPEHVARIRAAAPHAFPLLGYGLTETNAVGCANFNENYLARPGSTGPASRPLVELAILDEAGAALPAGTTGEVAIRSVCNILGYWDNPEATAAARTKDGFFRTGDLGRLDDDGYLFIVDRKKDVIIRGGENIASLEVEQAIYAHPDIAEASVFGMPDARLGEVPVAVWLAKPGRALDADGLRAFLARHLAAYKIPLHLWQVNEPLPRLGTEKVDKRALKARYS